MRIVLFRTIYLGVFLTSFSLSAQNNKDFRYFDTLSYQMIAHQDWDSMVIIYEDAIANQQNWFYLQLRVGIAFYEKKEYDNACVHFKKAYRYNSNDLPTQEYLYYSLLFSGKSDEARAFTKKMDTDLLLKINPPENGIINSVYIEGGLASSNNFSKNQHRISQEVIPGDYYETDLSNGVSYFHLGLTHQIGKCFTLYQAYSYVGIDKLKQIQFKNEPKYSSFDINTENPYKIAQHQYFLQVGWTRYDGLAIKPAFHLLYNKFWSIAWDNNLNYVVPAKTTLFEYLLSVLIEKNHGKFNSGISASLSNLGKGTQIQGGITFSYRFTQLHSLLSTSNLGIINDNNNDPLINGSSLRLFASEHLSLPLSSRIFSGISVSYGNLCHANELNGLMVYNSSDAINYKLGANISYLLNKHFYLSLYYNYSELSNSFLKFNNNISTVSHFNFTNQFIIGAIQWKL